MIFLLDNLGSYGYWVNKDHSGCITIVLYMYTDDPGGNNVIWSNAR